MAALTDTGAPALQELRFIRVPDLNALLDEEVAEWRDSLDWDFRASADLVRRFVGMRALTGHALMRGQELIGYSYFVGEESKGLVGDLYVRRQFRCPEYEDQLLHAALQSMASMPRLNRIEAQLMLLGSSLVRPVPRPEHLRRYQRNFMSISSAAIDALQPGRLDGEFHLEQWSHRVQEQAASLIAAAYSGHIDSEINDQYRSVAGARRFLLNIVQYPGCGSFFPPGSFLAVRTATGEVTGLVLSSLVAPMVGHITQICVLPEVRHRGIGYELLRRSLEGLAQLGCRKVSLTVTDRNREASGLYERLGFVTERKFAAYVWEGFRSER